MIEQKTIDQPQPEPTPGGDPYTMPAAFLIWGAALLAVVAVGIVCTFTASGIGMRLYQFLTGG